MLTVQLDSGRWQMEMQLPLSPTSTPNPRTNFEHRRLDKPKATGPR